MRAPGQGTAGGGLWLEDVPEPEVGINDVLIRVRKTGICGTDVHIYSWDAWAQKTIPVPMVVGHEFVGEVAALGSNVSDFSSATSSAARDTCLRAVPKLHGGAPAPVRPLDRARRAAAGRLRRVRRPADDEPLAPRAGD